MAPQLSATYKNGLGLFATDTVWGIGCFVHKENPALEKVFRIKKRPRTQTLPLLVPSLACARSLAQTFSKQAEALAEAFWSGALTLIVEASQEVPPEYLAPDGSIALRLPNEPGLVSLMKDANMPLANTSANLHGKPPALTYEQVPQKILDACDWTHIPDHLVSKDALGLPSTILDVRSDTQSVKLIRQGAISAHNIEEVLKTCR